MTTAELAKAWLQDQGFKCNIDEDGDAMFKYNGASMYVSVDQRDPLFMRIIMPCIYEVDGDREKVLEAVNEVTSGTKVVKAFIVDGTVHLTVEMFVDSTPEVDDFFERCCDILVLGRQRFIEAITK